MSVVKKYFLFFISAILLITSLIMLTLLGMNIVVGVLLAVGVISCLSCFFYYINKLYIPTHYQESSVVNTPTIKPEVKSLEQEYAPKNDYVEEPEISNEQKPKKIKEKSVSKKNIFRPKMSFETAFQAKSNIKEEDKPTFVCPHCKYKNYSTEIYCQNCGELLSKKEK